MFYPKSQLQKVYDSRMGQKTRFPGNKIVLLSVSDTDVIIKKHAFHEFRRVIHN